MNKILTGNFNHVPFSNWLEINDLSVNTSILLPILVLLVLSLVIFFLINKWKAGKLAKKLDNPYFPYDYIMSVTKRFIETHSQQIPPSRTDDLDESVKYIKRDQEPLISFFINTAFNQKRNANNVYLILADSGMGKTTFMINLFLRYYSSSKKKYTIKLYPLSNPDLYNELKNFSKEDARNTILLLDAFDEDPYLAKRKEDDNLYDDDRFRKRLDEWCDVTKDFRDVVISSRTQYFPGQETEDYKLKIRRYDESGYHIFIKFYLSPFTPKEVNEYLYKTFGRYSFWNSKKIKFAQDIVNNSSKLMARPLLLSYIEFLTEDNKNYATSYQIYETLIDKWLHREAKKRTSSQKEYESFKQKLYKFSHVVALEIYQNFRQKQDLFLKIGRIYEIMKEYDIALENYQSTGQSLLTRDALHNWKFAHKSILEFFLAKEAIENFHFAIKLNFIAMDMARHFYEEVGDFPLAPSNFVFVKGGSFLMNNKFNNTVNDFYISKYQMTQIEYVNITGKENPSKFQDQDQNPVEQVSWLEAAECCNILNEKIGYPPVYSDDYQLLTPEGEKTYDIKKVVGFRLPSEAEWEYVAGWSSAPTGSRNTQGLEWAGTNNEQELVNYAWYEINSDSHTHPIGELMPNALGLYDLCGNVWEWCSDWHGATPEKDQSKISVVETGTARVLRGGSWESGAAGCRLMRRGNNAPDRRSDRIGFRLVFAPKVTK